MSDYSYSGSDDEADVPLSLSQRRITEDTEYRIKGALKTPYPAAHTVNTLSQMWEDGDIDLDAEYQRDVVWPDAKQIGLIDSIFRNYYVPPIIFVVKRNEDGMERRVCVDGKQRLTSIFRFLRGEIPYKDPITGDKYWYSAVGNNFKTVKLLPERYRKIFKTKSIVCIEYHNLPQDTEREIFKRVQLGMALTPAERLQSTSSPTASFIREIVNTYVEKKLAHTIAWDTSRGGDFRGVTNAVWALLKQRTLTSPPTFNQLESFLGNEEPLDETFCNKVRQVLHIFLKMSQDEKLNSCFNIPDVKKVAPVELSEAIMMMRKHIREFEKDIRMNGRVVKEMTSFIQNLNKARLKSDYGQPVASKCVPRSLKRKRKASEVEEEDDEEEDQLDEDEDGEDEEMADVSTLQPQRFGKPTSSKPLSKTSGRKAAQETPPAKKVAIQPTTASMPGPSSKVEPMEPSSFLPTPPLSMAQPSPSPAFPLPRTQQHPSQVQPSGSYIHPDRLAAIRAVKASPSVAEAEQFGTPQILSSQYPNTQPYPPNCGSA
ncbi:hypothetical protein ABKN59_010358 [Abortiporus biennis]